MGGNKETEYRFPKSSNERQQGKKRNTSVQVKRIQTPFTAHKNITKTKEELSTRCQEQMMVRIYRTAICQQQVQPPQDDEEREVEIEPANF